ncbi:MAG: ArsR/SmtB family transcription factor [Vulcanimicrobiaceae bacterium]
MVNKQARLDGIFFALADPTRRRIVEKLVRRALTVGEIAADFPISQPAISKHVKVLEESGLLVRDVVGRVHHCSLSPKAMQTASSWLDRQERYWNAALDSLDEYLETSTRESSSENQHPSRKRKP